MTSTPTTYAPDSWQADISALLDERDAREKVHEEIIEAYGRIAGRIGKSRGGDGTGEGGASDVESLRADLATAQTSNAKFIAENTALKAQLEKSAAENALLREQLAGLQKDVEYLKRRQRDYEAESKERGRFTENLQDQLVAAEIELNMSEERCKTLEAENEMLVKRWMDKKGREADEMNRHFQ